MISFISMVRAVVPGLFVLVLRVNQKEDEQVGRVSIMVISRSSRTQ